MGKLICSAGSKQDLENLINEYYFSSNWIIDENMNIINTKTKKKSDNIVVRKRGRWRFESA